MTLRTDDELDAALTLLAEKEGISKQQVLRQAVLRWADEADHRRRVDSAAARVLVDYAETLDRLGKA